MFRAFRIRPVIGLAVLASVLAGCFTEVGNAEDDRLLEAHFQIDYTPNPSWATKVSSLKADSFQVSILQFYLNIREAEFHLFDSLTNQRQEFHLWKKDSAVLPVDFTGKDTAAVLPIQKVGVLTPLDMRLECALPARVPLKSDTVDFTRFRNRGYIKGLFMSGRDTTRFLFALPKAESFQLVYTKATIDGWYSNGTYRCQYVFMRTVGSRAWICPERSNPMISPARK